MPEFRGHPLQAEIGAHEEPIQVLLYLPQPAQADEILKSLTLELPSSRVSVVPPGEALASALTSPGANYEVLVVDAFLLGELRGTFQESGPGGPDAPAVLVLLDVGLEEIHLPWQLGGFQLLKRPLLAGELASQIQGVSEHRRRNHLHRRADELERLRKVSLAITSTLEPKSLLDLVVREAVGLLRAKSGGLYELNLERKELIVIAEYCRPDRLGSVLNLGEGLAGWLVEVEGRDYIIEDDYSRSALSSEKVLLVDPPFGAVVEVKLQWQGKVLGVLYVDDALPRKFTREDAELLCLFADQASIALANSQLMARSEARGVRLRDLAAATREVMGDAREKELDERLELIARYVANVTDAQMAGVLLVRRPGTLVLEATHGERPDGVKKGRQFDIVNGAGTGLTGAIAFEGELVNLGYKDLLLHPAVRRAEVSASPAKTCFSLLAIPLTRRVGEVEVLIGLLRAENKRGPGGEPRQDIGFTEEDVESIKIFADAVVVALDLADGRAWLNRLVDSSPDGVIAIDRKANVTLFNREAERILGYTRAEAKKMKVQKLYADEDEPWRIGKLLDDSKVGRVDRFSTAVRGKDGVPIPIRHSSTWLYDSRGERIGSVGYFEDLREINLAELRLESLLKATSIVANATDLKSGLGELTGMMAALVPHSFCRILLMEEEGSLRVEAVKVAREDGETSARLTNALAKPMKIADWPGLMERLEAGLPLLLEQTHEADQGALDRLSQWLILATPLSSLLVVPLSLGRQVVGLIEFGESRSNERSHFRQEEIDFAAQIAAHTTALINRVKLLGEAERRGQQLVALDVAASAVRAQPERSQLFRELARLAAELVSCSMGALFLNHPRQEEAELVAQFGIPDQRRWIEEGRSQHHYQGLVGEAASAGELRIRLNWAGWEERDPVLRDLPLKTAAAVPLRFLGDTDAVILVGDATGRQRFLKADREVLERFATHASIALYVSGLISPEMRSMRHFRLLHKITHFIQQEDDADKILDAMLTGITAGYGLGFNRAAILFLGHPSFGRPFTEGFGDPMILEGGAAIGHLTKEEAERSWEESRQAGLDDFEIYLEHLKKGKIKETPLGREIRSVMFRIESTNPDPLSKVVLENRWAHLKAENLTDLPERIARVFVPTTELVVVPLEVRNEVQGLLLADNQFTGAEITTETIETLLTFVSTLSISLYNRRLSSLHRDASERLGRLFALSNRIAMLRTPETILRGLISEVPEAVDAAWVRLILLDRLEPFWSNQPWIRDEKIAHISTVRPDGNSILAMKTSKPVVIEDLETHQGVDSPFMRQKGIPAAICLPLLAHEIPLGVLWINYNRKRRFHLFEVEALLLFAGQIAVALDNALRLDELERLRAAVHSISLPANLEEVSRAVAYSAKELLGGNSSVLWPFDAVRGAFAPTKALIYGKTIGEYESLLLSEADGEFLARLIAERGSLAISDLELETSDPILESVRERLSAAGMGGFQGVALRHNGELVGSLQVNFHEARGYGERSLQLLAAFANHAGLAVGNSWRLDRVSRAKKAAEAVAHMTTLEDLEKTLKSVARSTCAALGSDSVVIFSFNSREGVWSYPPAYCGVMFPEIAWPEGGNDAISRSIVAEILKQDVPYVAIDLSNDALLGGHQFALQEGISACGAWPLRAAGERVGVMFVNFKVIQQFNAELRSDIDLFADQAAVAIRNKHLFDALEADRLLALQDFQHQIRSPIAQAHARAQEFAQQDGLNPELRVEMETIVGLCVKAERVSTNIKYFASLSRDKPIEAELGWHPVALVVRLVHEAGANQSLLSRPRLVRFELDEGCFEGWSNDHLFLDPRLVGYAVDNVLDNAFKFSSRETLVRASVGLLEDGRFCVGITNRGTPISPEEAPLATERGWQGVGALYLGTEGMGIGLWIVSNIMRSLGGEVVVVPTTPSGETEVRLIFKMERRDRSVK